MFTPHAEHALDALAHLTCHSVCSMFLGTLSFLQLQGASVTGLSPSLHTHTKLPILQAPVLRRI